MKTKRMYLIGLVLLALLLGGCKAEETGETIDLYYVNLDGTGLEAEEYELSAENTIQEIQMILDLWEEEPESDEYREMFPKGVRLEEWELQSGNLLFSFNEKYKQMDVTTEMLLRAAIVQTFTQLKAVEYVDIYVEDEPLKGQNGEEVGAMNADAFVKNTGSSLHSTQVEILKLYFVNQDGTKLTEEQREVHYNSNMSIEKLVIKELMDGPERQGNQRTIGEKCKMLGIQVKDGTCYVNFDSAFLETVYPFDPKLTIYSMVNSIVENGAASQLQILVNGENDVKYMESIDLSKPLSRDLDLVEKEKN